MNERQSYEHIISGKLQALPVPDMADAIWARIETQLDIDMPTDDGPGGGGDAPHFPTGGFFVGGISVIVVAVLYFLFMQTNKSSTPTTDLPQQNTTVTPQPIASPDKGPPDAISKSNNTTTGTYTAPANALPQAQATDSSFITNIPVALRPDSTAIAPVLPQVTAAVPPKKDTLLPAKKSRGVTGLTDNDYRIVPKKDSANN